ncbi:glycoside hydrolase family 28 protein [Rhizobium sp. WYJ-E13]|uniref:polygalacturonase PglB n=1 Tax=Rhizobium sp. WYJ-E13 TaxID=2849093 RepID=UPI001C1ED01E|nr:glycosyl hydrolase family 28 protein [Rhizobium sp. WYJ-E13]QWW70716.1 glycoside hydrolase family 28 protein [Rhizobium sp. WYJ-E13]
MEIFVEAVDGGIQMALDTIAAAGGGTVFLRPGRHSTGALRLRSDVTLHIEEGAVLAFVADYELYSENAVSVRAESSNRAYIVAQEAMNIAIVGKGSIDGRGDAFHTGFDEGVGTFTPVAERPRVIVFEDCTNIRLEDVHITDSPMWTIHLVRCRDIGARGLRVSNNRQLPNTDGIVIDSCSDVTISEAVIRTADDGVCLKTSLSDKGIGRCERIEICDSVIESKSCALKIGTESFGDVSQVRFLRCRIENSNRGLGIFSRDGGKIEDVVFRDIELDCSETPDGFWGSGEPFTITKLTRRPERPAGAVRMVLVENVSGRSHGAVNLFAEEPGGIDGIVLRGIDIKMDEGPLGAAKRYDLRPTNADLAPPKGAQGRGNAWVRGQDGQIVGLFDYPGGLPGVFAQNVTGLELEDITIRRPEPLPAGWNPATTVLIS